MNGKPILIVGSMAFDDLQFPMPVPDPEAEGQTRTCFTDVVGGAATYAAYAASCFTPVQVVAVVGDDFPEATIEALKSRGVDARGIERADGKTFRWSGRYHADMVGRDTLDTQLNVFADFRPKLPESYLDAPLVLLGNIHPALQLEVLEQVRKPALVMADTMNFWISGESDTLGKLLEKIDLLVINDEEARQLSGIHNITQAAAAIRKLGPDKLVIKRGEHGALYFDGSGVFAAPALPLEKVYDPTGAGDSFAGGLLGYLASHDIWDNGAMRRAIVHGTATASFCVEALGTSGLGALTRPQVAERVTRIRALYHVGEEPQA